MMQRQVLPESTVVAASQVKVRTGLIVFAVDGITCSVQSWPVCNPSQDAWALVPSRAVPVPVISASIQFFNVPVVPAGMLMMLAAKVRVTTGEVPGGLGAVQVKPRLVGAATQAGVAGVWVTVAGQFTAVPFKVNLSVILMLALAGRYLGSIETLNL